MTVNVPITGLPAAVLPLTGAEITALVQNGVTVEAPVNALAPAAVEVLVSSSISVTTGTFYGVRTGLGAFTLTLPALSSVTPPNWLEIADMDNAAGVNNITINAHAGDVIFNHGTSAASYTITVNNTITRILANASGWRAIQYGF